MITAGIFNLNFIINSQSYLCSRCTKQHFTASYFMLGIFTARKRSKIFIWRARLGSVLPTHMIGISIDAIWKYVCKYKSVTAGWLRAKLSPRFFDLSDG